MSDKSPFLNITTHGVIFLVSIVIVIAQHFSNENFGIIGLLAWLVVLAGVGSFIYNAFN